MVASLSETIVAASLTVLANGLGGLPFLFVRDFPERLARTGWAVSGGLMLSASMFNLIMPGVADGGITPVAIGILAGAGVMALTSRWLHEHEFAVDGLREWGE